MLKHWGSMLKGLGDAANGTTRLLMSEDEFAEPILTYYEFGRLAYEARGIEEEPGRGARVLFVSSQLSMLRQFVTDSIDSHRNATAHTTNTYIKFLSVRCYTGRTQSRLWMTVIFSRNS